MSLSPTAKLLADLIALPSVNPAFLPERDPRAGEGRVAEFLASVAAQAGLDVELAPVFPHRPNLLARLTPTGQVRQRVVLAPHLDTVDGGPAAFTPQQRGARLHGRGACDTKGSIAAMLSAVCELARAGRRPAATEIVFAGLIDEEHVQAGSRALAASGWKADLAIVGEPTRCRVVTAHKGSLWFRLETRGKAAHGATPHLGINAVHAAARIVDLLETEYAASLRQRQHVLLGEPTVNVGAIRGGTQANIVPDAAVLEVDRRTLPGETGPGVRRELRALLATHGLKATVTAVKPADCPALETDPRLPLVQQFLARASQAKPEGAQYFCDAAVLAAAGIPSVVFGPGDIAQAHTADEWIDLRSLERGKELLVKLLSSLP